jgi:SAM-dependent methyltransferase
MAQITTGIRSTLSVPFIYESFQKLMGTDALRRFIISKYVTPYAVDTFLDIGCGPAEILSFMGEVDYYGFDISQSYIDSASKRYGDRGHFYARYFTADDLVELPEMDIAMMFGVLHHLDDDVAEQVIQLTSKVLKPGGRLVTVDPVFVQGQHPIARFLVSKDRGQNVRTPEAYKALVQDVFTDVQVDIRHKSVPPYTHCIMECRT